ncbi:helix-turn-helix domain-containing protein [Nocardia sp. NPDC059239]|uniref:helix-turn-helix domain-containing protein n=1 Tax=Nocardia sp. NPDC059239 TaxID=3346785 RepID=UPI0036AEF5FE
MSARTFPPTPAAVDLGRSLRAVRESAGLSQRDVAAGCNYSHVMVHRAETGKWPISWGVVRGIAGALDAERMIDRWESMWGKAQIEAEHEYARLREQDRLRSAVGQAPMRYIPRPSDAESVASYQQALVRLRRSAGNPSYDEMARRSYGGSLTPRTTLYDLTRPGRVELRHYAVQAFLDACGVVGAEARVWLDLLMDVPMERKSGRRRPLSAPVFSAQVVNHDR